MGSSPFPFTNEKKHPIWGAFFHWCRQPDSITLWCHRRRAAAEGQSAGLSHLDGFESSTIPKQQIPGSGICCFGAGNRTRTGTLLTARDFKSLVSTDFTMPAWRIEPYDNTNRVFSQGAAAGRCSGRRRPDSCSGTSPAPGGAWPSWTPMSAGQHSQTRYCRPSAPPDI